MSSHRPLGSVRIAFTLGPWRSPHNRGWQAAYDGIVEPLAAAQLPLYGILEASLADGDIGSAKWYTQYVTNAANVIARYGDRIPTFEVLPDPNRRDASGKPALSPAAFARTLALVYEEIKASGQARQTVLVAGAVTMMADGLAYLAQTLTFGIGSTAWETVRTATNSAAPFDGVAFWPALPETSGPIPANVLPDQVDRIQATLATFPPVSDKPLYLSGFTWNGQGGGPEAEEIEAALVRLARTEPGLRYAARDTTLAGPAVMGASPSLVGGFAITGPSTTATPAEVAASTTVVDGFDFPVGPRDADEPPPGYYSAVGLANDDYYRTFRAWHTGDDWNGPGPGDADLGLPVYATANGVVVASGYYSPAWGNIVVIQHTLPNGATLWTQYAHLKERLAQVGQVVERGQIIGSIGKGANNIWPAHLHYEMRQCDLPPDNWQPFVSDRARVLACYFPTIPFTRQHRPAQFEASGVIVDSEPGEQLFGAFVRSDTPHWYTTMYGWNGSSLYTYASPQLTEWGEWRPRLGAAGRYDIQAFIPAVRATTINAQYLISHDEGQTSVSVDQSRYFDEWVSLGVYPFPADGASVRLTDQTGEPDAARREVNFDALRWLKES